MRKKSYFISNQCNIINTNQSEKDYWNI